MLAEKYPLQWPTGYPRTKWTRGSRFGNVTFAGARDAIFQQLKLLVDHWDRDKIVLSTNVPLRNDGIPYATYKQPEDKGVAVYFTYKKEQMVLCCDEWNKIEHNLWAIAKTIEAIRGIERWGVSDFLKHAFTGFIALPPSSNGQTASKTWYQVLNYQQLPGKAVWDWAGVEAQYKSLAKQRHPDAGGSTELFQELSWAFSEAKKYFGK